MEFVVVLLLNWKGQICQQNSTIGKGRVSVSTTSISWLRSKRGILMKMKFVDQISKGYWYANHPFRVNYKDTHSLSVWWKQYFRIQILAKFSLTYTKHICKHVRTMFKWTFADLHIILVHYSYAKGLHNIFCFSLWGQNWVSRPNPHSSVADNFSSNWLSIWNGFCEEILPHFQSLTKFHFNLASSKELILLLYVENQMEKSILSLVCLISFDWNGWLHQQTYLFGKKSRKITLIYSFFFRF